MKEQLEFEFRSLEEIAKAKQIKADNEKVFQKMFSDTCDDYVYNKHVDFFLDFFPFRLSWKALRWPSQIRWWAKCKYQKIKYGVSDDDVYSLYYNIAIFALPRLKYFRDKGKFDIPAPFLPDDFHSLEGDAFDKAEEQAIKEWKHSLDEMIFAFEYIIDGDKFCEMPDALFHRGIGTEHTIEEKQAWKDYMEKAQKLSERKDKGLELFAKYFECLWI